MTRLTTLLLIALSAVAARPSAVEVGDPVLVTEGPASEHRWGRYQFPTVERLADGRLIIFVHVEADSVDAYGKPGKTFVSSDQGATWTSDSEAANLAYGFKLPNGDYFRTATTAPVKVNPEELPKPVGAAAAYRDRYTMYRLSELPPLMRLIFFNRYAAGVDGWRQESTPLDFPGGLRGVLHGVLPRIWWGDMRLAGDGSLVAVTYPAYLDQDGKVYCHSVCYRSTDSGKSWKFQGRIAYRPDAKADPHAAERGGFFEPALEVLRDGSLLSVLRTTDGHGVGPMFFSRSRNLGRTWTRPKAFTPTGVLPRLLLMGNGTMVLSSGRPGVDLRFSFDGKGKRWTEARRLVPISAEGVQVDSCGYTGLVPLNDNTFLIVYSWFRRPGADGLPHKAILVRRVAIQPQK